MPPWAAVVISVTLILMFGEVGCFESISQMISLRWICIQNIFTFISFCALLQILPQAVCTRYGLTVGATMAPFVRVLLMLFLPISYPISKVM